MLMNVKYRAYPASPRMYPAEKTAIQVATNVTVASMTAAKGSSVREKSAFRYPASNHVTGSGVTWTGGAAPGRGPEAWPVSPGVGCGAGWWGAETGGGT